jgi:tetratricopeptide (TPR) repeat protein
MSRVEVLDDDEPCAPRVESEAERLEREQQRADEEGEGPDRAACNRLKLRGNKVFQLGNIETAAELYVKALRRAFVRPLPPRKDPFDRPKAPPAAGASAEPPAPAEEPAPDPVDPNEPEYVLTAQVNCNLGACYLRLSKHEDAERALTEALRHDGAYEKALLRRADCYWHMAKWSSAYADWQSAEKGGAELDPETRQRCTEAKAKTDAEMAELLSQLKGMGNALLGKFGMSTDNFKFDKDPKTGGYSMRFER